jgi:hypothetical protein
MNDAMPGELQAAGRMLEDACIRPTRRIIPSLIARRGWWSGPDPTGNSSGQRATR